MKQVRGSAFDPVLTLASVLEATPGSHVALLGAGISVSAGVPSAWGVQEWLIRRIARAEGVTEELDTPHDWYRSRFEREATYESLLEGLAPTQHARQAILRDLFEPDPADPDRVPSEPSPSHRALARLATSRSIRIFLTLNFDHLMERALREEGIEPTVVRSVDDLKGLAPLHTLNAIVVHLHGDYLTPISMRNTTTELADYDLELQNFLDRVLSDHALIAVGWSAEYDPALRAATDKSLLQRYGSYWVTRGELGPLASDLAVRHRIEHVRGDANVVMGRLADAVTAIADRRGRHPLTLAESIAGTKRELSGRTVAMSTHDRLRQELTALREQPDLNRTAQELEGEPYPSILGRLTEASIVPAGLIAAAAYWGNEETDRWWFEDLRRFSADSRDSGLTKLLALPRACGSLLYQAALVGAVAAGRWDLAHRLLCASAEQHTGTQRTLREQLAAMRSFAIEHNAPSARALAHLSPIFTDHLALGARAYEESWELAEILVLVEQVHSHPQLGERITRLAVVRATESTAEERMREAEGTADLDSHDNASERLGAARQDAGRALGAIADLVGAQGAHIRFSSTIAERLAAPAAERVLADLRREGAAHPILRAGFAARNQAVLEATLEAISLQVGRIGKDRADRALIAGPGHGGVISSYLWIDTEEPPRF
ncbi:hypothetical protein OJAG_30880 [Oerskovia enterophila]|uniref:Uncharacterized protein n=1 Tax=Oerskovia enterophila TaxID=43678 RepID=A0A163QKJ5_9CELL|nr:hypothetical protein OJAG_30880 [Oerskovia enterophila]